MPDCTPLFNLKHWRPPNLAMTSLAGNLEGHEVRIGDLLLNRDNIKQTITELINDYRPDVVGTSAMSFQFATANRIATLVKSISKETVTGTRTDQPPPPPKPKPTAKGIGAPIAAGAGAGFLVGGPAGALLGAGGGLLVGLVRKPK